MTLQKSSDNMKKEKRKKIWLFLLRFLDTPQKRQNTFMAGAILLLLLAILLSVQERFVPFVVRESMEREIFEKRPESLPLPQYEPPLTQPEKKEDSLTWVVADKGFQRPMFTHEAATYLAKEKEADGAVKVDRGEIPQLQKTDPIQAQEGSLEFVKFSPELIRGGIGAFPPGSSKLELALGRRFLSGKALKGKLEPFNWLRPLVQLAWADALTQVAQSPSVELLTDTPILVARAWHTGEKWFLGSPIDFLEVGPLTFDQKGIAKLILGKMESSQLADIRSQRTQETSEAIQGLQGQIDQINREMFRWAKQLGIRLYQTGEIIEKEMDAAVAAACRGQAGQACAQLRILREKKSKLMDEVMSKFIMK